MLVIDEREQPTYAAVQVLRDRRRQLLDIMQPGAPSQMAIFLIEMFRSYLNAKAEPKNVDAYLSQIKMFPGWIVERACRQAAARDEPFPVSAGQLRAICKSMADPVYEELADLRNILEAKVYHRVSPEERQRIGEGLRQLAHEVAASNRMLHEKRTEENKRIIAGIKERGAEMMKQARERKVAS